MAYVPKQIPEDEQNLFGRQEQTTPNPAPVEGGGSAGSGTAQGGAAPGVGTSTQFGSNAAKLTDYLKANQGQVQEFGNQVAGKLNEGYSQTMNDIDQGYGNFSNQVNQGYAAPNEELVNQAKSDPTNFVKNQNNVNSFQSLYNNQYSGPNDFESSDVYGNLNNEVNKAVENSSLANSQGGLGTYLNNFMGTQNNTSGMKALDTALLQRSPEAQNAIKSAADPYKNLTSYLSDKAQSANQNIAGAKNTANQTKQDVQNQFTGQNGIIPTFQNDLNQRLSNTRKTEEGKYNAANTFLSQDPAITDEQLALLGGNRGAYNNILGLNKTLNGMGAGLDLNQYFSNVVDPNQINIGNVTSSDEAAKAQALAALTGQDLSGYSSSQSPLQGNLPDIDDIYAALQMQGRRFGIGGPTGGVNATGGKGLFASNSEVPTDMGIGIPTPLPQGGNLEQSEKLQEELRKRQGGGLGAL